MSSVRKAGHAHPGFTLVEVLVAITILAVGIVGVLAAFSQSMQVGSRAMRRDEAGAIAQRQLELATVQSVDSLHSRSGSSGPYTWTMTFQEKPHGLVRASVSVKWQERGQQQQFVLSQIYLPRGAGQGGSGDLVMGEKGP